jgi:hypothetical protein
MCAKLTTELELKRETSRRLPSAPGLVDITCIVYLNNILVFLETEKKHVVYIKEVL